MTLKEINELTMEAYRRGYNDAMSDRAARAQDNSEAFEQFPKQNIASTQTPESIEAFNLAMANFLGYDGSQQESVEQTLKRTRT